MVASFSHQLVSQSFATSYLITSYSPKKNLIAIKKAAFFLEAGRQIMYVLHRQASVTLEPNRSGPGQFLGEMLFQMPSVPHRDC